MAPAGSTWSPPDTTPATPYLNLEGDTIILYLPVFLWLNTPSRSEASDSSNTDSNSDDELLVSNPILNQLMTPPTQWEGELWHWISCHSNHDNLNQTIAADLPVHACSNMEVNAAKFSTFLWIIYSDHALWQGEGIIPGLADNMYSGQSEAFGIYTAVQFLSNYLLHYPNTYYQAPNIMVYCDSQGVLDCIQKLHSLHTILAHSTTADDYDIYTAIWNTLHKQVPITIQFVHVKGHQDHNCKQQSSLPEKLNIECNKQASEYLPMARHMKLQPNLMIPNATHT